jgi:hypothetical protein
VADVDHGPAVNVSDLQVAIRAMTVEVQWDHLGLGFVVYPEVGYGGRARRVPLD